MNSCFMLHKEAYNGDIMFQDNWNPDWQATSSSKVAYLIEKLKLLKGISINQSLGQEKDNTHPMRNLEETATLRQLQESAEKAIVFSQFLEHINVIESQVIFFFLTSSLWLLAWWFTLQHQIHQSEFNPCYGLDCNWFPLNVKKISVCLSIYLTIFNNPSNSPSLSLSLSLCCVVNMHSRQSAGESLFLFFFSFFLLLHSFC